MKIHPPESSIAVLHVEDSVTDMRIVQRILPQGEFHVTGAPTAAAAREALAERAFHLVLLDHGLPDTNALAFLDELRTGDPDLPVVVLTGREDEALAVSSIRKGARSFVLKDEMRRTLLTVVRDVLGVNGASAKGSSSVAGHTPQDERFIERAGGVYRTLLEMMNDGCFVVDGEGVVTFANATLAYLAGMDPVGRSARDLFDEKTARRLESWRNAAVGSDSARKRFSFEGKLRRPDGETVPILVSSRLLVGEAGRHECFVATLSDIRDLARERDELVRGKRELLLGAAHAAAAAGSAIDNLLHGAFGELEAAQRRQLEMALAVTGQLSGLLSSLVDPTPVGVEPVGQGAAS